MLIEIVTHLNTPVDNNQYAAIKTQFARWTNFHGEITL